MSDKNMLNEGTIRRFMKLANVGALTDNFVNEKNINEQDLPPEDEADPGLEDAMVAGDEDMAPPEDDMDLGDEEDAGGDEEMGAADISLTEEEAQLLIDLGERLQQAMEGEEDDLDDEDLDDEPMEEPMEEPTDDAMEEPMDDAMEEPGMGDSSRYAGMSETQKHAVVQEVLKRVTKRILSSKRR